MKHFLTGCGIATTFVLIAAILFWLLPHADDICLQQHAGYQAVVTTQTNLLQTQIDLLAKERARAGLLQVAHTALQEEFAVMLASRVGTIDDVMEGPEAIAIRAKRLAPVEAAVKEVAKQEPGFLPVPWLKQQLTNSAKLAGGRWK